MTATNDRIDIRKPIADICHRLGLDPNYVARIDFRPGDVHVVLYRGKDGRCKGAKYIDETTGHVATDSAHYEVWA